MEAVRDERERKDRTFSPASKLDTLSDHQKEEVESQSRPNAALIHETIRAEGVSELERTAAALLLSGLAAGLSNRFLSCCPRRTPCKSSRRSNTSAAQPFWLHGRLFDRCAR